MATTVTVLEVGGLPASPPRPASPKLGDFSKIFDMGFFLTSKPKLPNPPVKLPSRPTSPLLPETISTAPRFLDGLDLSKLSSPAKSEKLEPKTISPTSTEAHSTQKSTSSATETYSTPATSPPKPTAAKVKAKDKTQSTQHVGSNHNYATSAKPVVAAHIQAAHDYYAATRNFKHSGKYNGKPIATAENEDDPEFDAYFDAYWKVRADAAPGWNSGLSAIETMQIAEQERIIRVQKRALTSPYMHEFLFSVPWSCVPHLQDMRPHIAPQPWSDGLSHHVGPKPPVADSIGPLYSLPKATQLAVLKAELLSEYLTDRTMLVKKDALRDPLHVFVDLSNIVIGFYDCIKLHRGIPPTQKIRAPPFFFEAFAMLLERGRNVAKRVLAGSVVDPFGIWPQYMLEAQQCGYEMNILQRVAKSPKRKGRGAKHDTTSGADSSDDTRGATKRSYPLKRGEQGVDEILHLKIAQSILDYNPSTMVLATGDAAEAEYSDGFKKNVERALERGWNVELIAWHKGISSSWRELKFAQKWGSKFRIIEIDSVVEELLAFYTIPMEGELQYL